MERLLADYQFEGDAEMEEAFRQEIISYATTKAVTELEKLSETFQAEVDKQRRLTELARSSEPQKDDAEMHYHLELGAESAKIQVVNAIANLKEQNNG